MKKFMKLAVTSLLTVSLLAACGGNSNNTSNDTVDKNSEGDIGVCQDSCRI